MEFNEVVRRRYSVRAYKPDPVEDDKLNRVLDAARLAPTACNRQPFRLFVVHSNGREQELRKVYKSEWFVSAPLIICACGVPSEGWTRFDGRNYTEVDVTIAMDHLILAAANEGLGTCWIAAFDDAAVREMLHLPDDLDPVVLTPLGYPADEPRTKRRKELADLVVFE